MNKLNIIGLLLLIFISSCRKDINDISDKTVTDETAILTYTPIVDNIVGSLLGQVVDENNEPMSDVKIRMNGEDYFTNELGLILLNDITMNSRGQLIQAFQNATHFPGSRRFFPQAGATSRIKIQMITKEFSNEFSSLETNEVLIEGGAKVKFEPNSIKDSNGNIYEGTVWIASHWMDPLVPETFDEMPGNLQGVNQLSEEVALQTFGMIAVELETPNGEKLNIAEGKTATITMPVPDDLLSIAPEVIPLWSYNEEFGLWSEEGSASLQNGNYVGTVSHFSFWNCDYPHTLVELDATFTDSNGNPLIGKRVRVDLNTGSTCYGYTDNNGTIAGLFPADEILTFTAFDICNDVIFSHDFGPYSSNTSLGSIAVLLSTVNGTAIKGTLRDCDNNLVSNGLVIVNMNDIKSYYNVGSGEFEILITPCLGIPVIGVHGVNMDNLDQSSSLSAVPTQVNELGDIDVCGNGLENYIRIIYDSDVTLLFTDAVVQYPGFTHLYSDAGGTVSLNFLGNDIGDYSDENCLMGFSTIYHQNSLINLEPLPGSTSSGYEYFIVTEYNSKLVGTFGGPAINTTTGVEVEIVGDFSINF